MTAADLLHRLDGVRSRSTGKWLARCPAHQDNSPSLSIAEGDRGLLLRCWAGCAVQEICEALHISVRDLFYEEPGPVARRRTVPATRIDKRTIALQFDVHADALRERGHAVLSAAVGLNISEWMDHELDKAISAVAHAHHDLQRASLLEDVADRLRCRDWEERRARQHAA